MPLNNVSDDQQIDLPDHVRHALLMILRQTLLYIRSTKNSALSFALSDHAHNIPGLIDSYSLGAFRYYWEVERDCFVQAMEKLCEPFGRFREDWSVLEKYYESLPRGGVA